MAGGEGMAGADRGYLTLAVGKISFLEMAVDMALSLRVHTEDPVGIVTDEGLQDVIRRRFAGVFDAVTLLPPAFRNGRALKYGLAEASPFEENVFIDADCVVLAPLEHVWAALSGSDMGMLGELLTSENDETHHGFSTRWLMSEFKLDRYLKTNSGLFAFRRGPTTEVMRDCLDCYLHEARPRLRWSLVLGKWVGDEIAFGIVGGRRRIATLPGPQAMFWPAEFDSVDLAAPQKPLLHMLWPLPSRTLSTLIEQTTHRRKEAGVPLTDGAHWRDENKKLLRMARRRSLFQRLGLS